MLDSLPLDICGNVKHMKIRRRTFPLLKSIKKPFEHFPLVNFKTPDIEQLCNKNSINYQTLVLLTG